MLGVSPESRTQREAKEMVLVMNTRIKSGIAESRNLVKVITFHAIVAVVVWAFTDASTALRVYAWSTGLTWLFNVLALAYIAGKE
jgi:hypothetical protein